MKNSSLRILSIVPTAGGCAYAVLDAKRGLLDFGFRETLADEDERFLDQIARIAELTQINTLLLENVYGVDGRPTAERRSQLAVHWAHSKNIGVCQISRRVVNGVLGAGTIQERARQVIQRFPELEVKRPPPRMPWGSQDDRNHVFGAVALCMCVINPERS